MCNEVDYKVIDAAAKITGRDFLLKIWKLIASAPLAVGIAHEDIPFKTQANIFYELGVADALGKETIIIKSPRFEMPSDFARSEYIVFDNEFKNNFKQYLANIISDIAPHYEFMAEQLDKNPILALDYLKRAFLINGDLELKNKAKAVLDRADLKERAKNSVEMIAAEF